VGGPLEWSVLWTVAAQGFVVVGVMAAFGAFNAVASHHELLQSTPRAFHEPGLVLTVALAFVPSTIATIAAVREADRARTAGRVVRRGRLVRLVIPVLETGLERAVDLADSMDARGFGRGRPTRTQQVAGWLGLGCLVGLGGTVVALVGGAHEVAALLALVGTGCLVAAVLIAPIGHGPTRYRPRRLTRTDAAVLVAVAAAPLGLGVCAFVGESSLTWVTTLPLRLPSFHVLPAACLALLASPALVRSPSSDPPDDDGPVAGVPVDADTPSYSMVGR